MRGDTPRWVVCCLLLFVCVALHSGLAIAAWGQGNTAVVTGSERVFIRRGPGTEFPAFATLTRGSAVEVQEMQGEWSRVKTASGQVGYVHSNFLALPSEARPGAAAETPRGQPTPPPAPHSDAAALTALTEKNKALEAQLSALQDELTTLKNRPAEPTTVAPTAAPASGDAEELRAEIKRLTAAVEGLQHQTRGAAAPNEAPATTAPVDGTERSAPSTALVIGALGLLVGWLAGAAYGRSQERGRRSRIRF